MARNANYSLFMAHYAVSLSLSSSSSSHADAYRTCNCPYCAPFFQVPPSVDSLCTPLKPLQSAKYLGSYITPTSSSVPDVNFRCSQASSAFKTLDPFFRHPLISQKNKLRVYTQIVQAILLHGSESQVYSPAQVTKIDSLQYKALRQIFKIKSQFYHRVILPSDSPCSNEYLLSLSYPVHSTCIPSSFRISDSRLKYLGHIHPQNLSLCSTHHIHFTLSHPPFVGERHVRIGQNYLLPKYSSFYY